MVSYQIKKNKKRGFHTPESTLLQKMDFQALWSKSLIQEVFNSKTSFFFSFFEQTKGLFYQKKKKKDLHFKTNRFYNLYIRTRA